MAANRDVNKHPTLSSILHPSKDPRTKWYPIQMPIVLMLEPCLMECLGVFQVCSVL